MRTARVEALFALLLAALAPAAGAAELGTLFHTPEERERLEQLRRGEAPQSSPTSAPGERRLTGFVKRSDGRNTVWIDGVAIPLSSNRAAPLLEPGAVRQPGERPGEVRVERKPPA